MPSKIARPFTRNGSGRAAFVFFLAISILAFCGVAAISGSAKKTGQRETITDPPGIPARSTPGAPKALPVQYQSYISRQVNVDSSGADIAGDAANEPSITVDPNHPNHMAIGWRQFDTVTSSFREAGYAYTRDGGRT